MTAVTIPADRDITITPHADGSVTLDGLVATDMPVAEPVAVGSIITFTNKYSGLKNVGIKTAGFYDWRTTETDGDINCYDDWNHLLKDVDLGTLRVFPAPRG